jgi:Cof subfamily protein (haloacid dehalogenase superfamily)
VNPLCCASSGYPPKVIGLILIDVDGTYVGQEARIHEEIPAALDEARGRSVHLGLCTGRPSYGLAGEYANDVSPNGLHVFQNGAVVSDWRGNPAHVSEMEPMSYRKIVEAARSTARPLEVYTPQAFYLERESDLTRRHAELLGHQPETRDLLDIPGPIVRVQWVVPMEELPEVTAATAAIGGLELNWANQMDMPGVAFASVTKAGTSKVSAAEWLAEHYGFTLAETAMVGDGVGDLELIRAAGLGIAMGNAVDSVKAAADVVVAPVDHGGLAEAVRIALSR